VTDEGTETRERWRHEDELINQRLTWLFSSQALICAGYAWLKFRVADITLESVGREAVRKELTDTVKEYIAQLQQLMDFLSYIGIFVSVFVGVGLMAACIAQNRLKRDYPDIKLGVSRETTNMGRLTALSLPAACLLAWAYMFTPQSDGKICLIFVSVAVIVAVLASLELAPKSQQKTKTR